jgi:hypothetical protein
LGQALEVLSGSSQSVVATIAHFGATNMQLPLTALMCSEE